MSAHPPSPFTRVSNVWPPGSAPAVGRKPAAGVVDVAVAVSTGASGGAPGPRGPTVEAPPPSTLTSTVVMSLPFDRRPGSTWVVGVVSVQPLSVFFNTFYDLPCSTRRRDPRRRQCGARFGRPCPYEKGPGCHADGRDSGAPRWRSWSHGRPVGTGRGGGALTVALVAVWTCVALHARAARQGR